ncbi:hypothetical protein TgHK011_007371 [Trichoderma gracile]|nr:hypothetical protein TgHK011_007371 [Trichoderma gracile]
MYKFERDSEGEKERGRGRNGSTLARRETQDFAFLRAIGRTNCQQPPADARSDKGPACGPGGFERHWLLWLHWQLLPSALMQRTTMRQRQRMAPPTVKRTAGDTRKDVGAESHGAISSALTCVVVTSEGSRSTPLVGFYAAAHTPNGPEAHPGEPLDPSHCSLSGLVVPLAF